MAHAVVTGAAGFIGSHVCERLLALGWRVSGIDSFDEFYDPAVKRRNVVGFIGHPRFTLIEGDIRDPAAVERALAGEGPGGTGTRRQGDKGTRGQEDGGTEGRSNGGAGVEVVIHLAARAGVRPSIEDPLLYQDVNVRGTNVLLEAARKFRIPKFVFASSSSVYGNNRKVPFSESDNVDNPISPYAATKKAGELLCYTYHHLFGINVTCLRFFTVYGPRQRPDLAIHKFARLIERGEPIPVFGDGSMMRDHTYVDDIVSGVAAAAERCKGYRIYNLGNSNPVSLRDLISAIEAAMGKKAQIKRLPLQPGDVERTFADVSLARAELGYEPRTDLKTGLATFVKWMRSAT